MLDGTESHKSETRIRQLNRVYAVLSAINQTIVREQDPQQMLEAACRITVEQGGFPMAWIGLRDEATGRVKIRAHAGADADTLALVSSLIEASPPAGCVFTQYALELGEHGVCNAIETDSRSEPWRAAALSRGYRALVSFPVKLRDRTAGVFNIYAAEAGFFNDKEIRLLDELAMDIGFALEVARREQARRCAEAALKESEERYRTTLDNIMEGCQLIGFDWRYLYLNGAAARHNRRANAELLGRKMTDAWPGIEGTAVFAMLRRCMEERIALHEEIAFDFSDGGKGWYDVRCQAVPEGIFVLSIDITERKLAEAVARREKILSDAVCDSVPGMLYLYDRQGRFLRWNLEFERLSGYSADEISRMHPLDFFAGEERALLARKIDEVFEAGTGSVEASFVAKNGTATPYFFTGRRIQLDATEYLVGMGIDISARKRAEALFQTAMDHALDAVITIDERGAIQTVNRATLKMFGYALEEVVGQNISMLMAPPYKEQHDGYLESYRRTGQAKIIGFGREVDGARRKDGSTFPIRLAVSEFNLEGRRHFLGIIMDLSETRSLESQLRQAQKMEAFGQLAGGVAHDFNNMLTVINGYSGLLVSRLPENDPSRKLLLMIKDAGERSAALTRQLLSFSRKQIVSPELLDLNKIVTNLEKMLHRIIGEDVKLSTTLSAAPASVRADPAQLEQVLMNLAVNARDAMPKGGKLAISTAHCELDAAYARSHPAVQPGAYVLLAVSDTGSGMSPEVQRRIFEPFFTTKGAGKGTGLGLAVVHGVVRQNGGHIVVYSEPEIGTVFKIYLPAAGENHGSHPASAVSQQPVHGDETILVVEDEQAVRELTRSILAEHGYTVLDASNGLEALRVAENHAGPIHLLVTDVVMPGLGGRELAERFLTLRPAAKVLHLSGYTDDAIVRHGILQDTVNFLQKPFTAVTLTQKVRASLHPG